MAMYTSREDARSDLFLSGAWYLFGPILVGLLIGITRLDRVGALRIPLALAFPIIFTALVPLLLMRYRGESLADLGIGGSGDRSYGPSLLAAVPLVIAAVVAALLGTGSPLPATILVAENVDVITVISQVLRWTGLLFLAYYATVKARDAFGGDSVRLEDGVVRIGRFVGIAAAAAIALVIIAQFTSLSGGAVLALLCYPVGVAVAVWLLLRQGAPSPTVSMPTILTPVVLLAIGPFVLTFNAAAFVGGVLLAAVFGGLGLIVAIVAERARRGTGLLALGVVIALATRLDGAGIFG
jgi:hypothetical protein